MRQKQPQRTDGTAAPPRNREGLDRDPLWYKSGVIYEVHVRAFYDSDADGTGDFRGLTEKLDYIKDLGVTAIWLLPFYPSPLKDDGYDIANYCDVHPKYGTLNDFKAFLREAHRRGLRVITELVLNHTSDQHPWFQRARRSKPGSRWRNFYIWSDTASEFSDARIIFKDVETSNWAWDPVAKAYFWHRFFSHQPDLNYNNPEVHDALIKALDFWLDIGVDGLRLDAVPYLYEREGTGCENLPETHAFLKRLRQHVDEKYTDRMLLAEANQWPEDAVAYLGQGSGNECHMAYHFPLMPRLFMAVRMEDHHPIVDILEQTPSIPETSQWALFLRNHDELSLEMVTEEERDYMWRMFAHVPQARLNLGIRRRLAPLMENDRKSLELLIALLFSLPGTPILYYGDEIGMGENIFLSDRNGVRTPMQWSPDKNAGFSRANPQSLYLPVIFDPGYHYEVSNVEVQLANPHSLLWWMRRLLALRKRWRALGEGKCEFLHTENRKILSYLLRYQQETLLVVANLSRFAQPVELDLSAFNQMKPVELVGRTGFPEITQQPYFLSLGPHTFYWFALVPKFAAQQGTTSSGVPASLPPLSVRQRWQDILAEKNLFSLKEILPKFLKSQPWFSGKTATIKALNIRECIPVALPAGDDAALVFLQVDTVEGESETYTLPLAFARGPEAEVIRKQSPLRVVAELRIEEPAQSGILYDAFGSTEFCRALLALVHQRRRLTGLHGGVEAMSTLRGMAREMPSEPSPARHDQSNSSVLYGDKLILKLFRRLEPGINPEVEVGRFLNAKAFPHSRTLAGALEYRGREGSNFTLAVVHAFLPDAKNASDYIAEVLRDYYGRVITWVAQGRTAPPPVAAPFELLHHEIPQEVREDIGPCLESAGLLGLRTAELHRTLASSPDIVEFAPEAYLSHDRRALFQSMRNLAVQHLRLLRRQIKNLPPHLQTQAGHVADLEQPIIQSYRALYERRFSGLRLRIHGNCLLSEMLWTGKDFVFIDFEGDTGASIHERRLKRSPLRDVASIVRSFHDAAWVGLDQHAEVGGISKESYPQFELWLRHWSLWINVAFLKAYLGAMRGTGILPAADDDLRIMLRVYILDGMVSELGRQLKNHGASPELPLRGILFLFGEAGS